MSYWLMKSEPDAFSIDDLKQRPGGRDHWDGVRNYQARNMMRDEMKKGDLVFFYHSNCKQPAIVGIMEVARESYADHTALDPESKYYDPKSSEDNPRWFMVDVRYKRKLKRPVTLEEIKQHAALKAMPLVQRGNRLSIMPVTTAQWKYILTLEKTPPVDK